MTRNEKSLQALFSNTEIIKSAVASNVVIAPWRRETAERLIKEANKIDPSYSFIEYDIGPKKEIKYKIFKNDNEYVGTFDVFTDPPYNSPYRFFFNHVNLSNVEFQGMDIDEFDKMFNDFIKFDEKYGHRVSNSRRPIKSGYDILNIGDKTPAGNLIFYLVNDGKRMPIMTEDYAIREGGYDKDYLYEGSKNGEFVRFDGFNRIINRLAKGCGITEYIDQIEYSIKGNKVEFTVYPTEQGIHLLNNGWWDDYSVRWELSAEEQIPLYDGDEIVAMTVTLTILGL